MTGSLVAVEGIDGSGKSTVARRLVGRLAAAGGPVLLLDRVAAVRQVRGGLGGWAGDHLAELRRLIWDYPPAAATSKLGFEHWSHLLAAWFAAVDHAVVRPALAAGTDVVADSWVWKFVARFALTVGVPEAQQVFAGVTDPSTVIWLDVDPRTCVARRTTLRSTEAGEWQGLAGGDEAFVAYQAQVRQVYGRLAAERGWVPAGAGTVDDVVETAYSRLRVPAT